MAATHKYNIIMLGEVGVGKTSIFNRIKTGLFHEGQRSTLGEDHLMYTTIVDGDNINVSLWDTGGSERYRALTGNYFQKANGALLVYCVEDAYTFENLQKWIDDASNHIKGESFVWALIGNKCDLPNEVEKVGVEQLCERLQTKLFYSVSAKTGHNVSEAFDELIATIHRKQLDSDSQSLSINDITFTSVEPTNKNAKTNSCCS